MSEKKPMVFLVAGGTAGHINGAISLGEQLIARGFQAHYISSKRSIDYRVLADFKENSWHLNSKALKGRGNFETIKNLFINAFIFLQVFFKTVGNRPKYAIGFGGFICGPTLLACRALGIPYYIVEQNSVMGMANKLLVPLSKKVFTHFKKTINFPAKYKSKVVVSGNPILSSIHYCAPRSNQGNSINSSEIRLLVFGGSLGAEEINDVVKVFIQEYTSDLKISIKHQVGQGKETIMPDHDKIHYQQVDYIDDMNSAYEWADAIVCRGGASTISELAIVRKPSFIFPYPHIDQHQLHNARMLQERKLFPVSYIEKADNTEDKLNKLSHFIYSLTQNHSFADSLICENNPEVNSAKLIFENISRDFL